MKIKLIFTLISLCIVNISYAKFYKCPNIKENIYHSILSEIDDWQIYAVKNDNNSIYNFKTMDIENKWNAYKIEAIYQNDMLLIFCFTENLNIQSINLKKEEFVIGQVRAFKFVEETNCSFDFIRQGFNCGN